MSAAAVCRSSRGQRRGGPFSPIENALGHELKQLISILEILHRDRQVVRSGHHPVATPSTSTQDVAAAATSGRGGSGPAHGGRGSSTQVQPLGILPLPAVQRARGRKRRCVPSTGRRLVVEEPIRPVAGPCCGTAPPGRHLQPEMPSTAMTLPPAPTQPGPPPRRPRRRPEQPPLHLHLQEAGRVDDVDLVAHGAAPLGRHLPDDHQDGARDHVPGIVEMPSITRRPARRHRLVPPPRQHPPSPPATRPHRRSRPGPDPTAVAAQVPDRAAR